MRKSLLFLVAVGFGLVSALSGCVDGDDSIGGSGNGNGNGGGGGSNTSEPQVTIQRGPDKFVRAGDSLDFQVLLESNSTIAQLNEITFELLRLNTNGNYEALPDYTRTISKAGIPSSGERFGALIESGTFASGDTLRAQFTLKNTDGGSTVKRQMIIVSEFMDDRVVSALEDTTLLLNHRFIDDPNEPKNKFSFFYTANFYDMGFVTSGPPDRKADIADFSASDSTYERRVRSKTDTRFVRANDADINFTYPLDVKVEAAYNAGTPTDVIENIQVDDIIIANVRQDDKFIVIKITQILEDTENATGRFMQFKATGKDLPLP